MKFLKSHFALSRRQQNGIFVLVLLIILFQVVIFFMGSFSEKETHYEIEKQVENFKRKLDSLNSGNSKPRDTIYPFNPNFITDFKGYQLGMSPEEIDRLLEYRKADKWVNSAEDFQKVTGVSDSLLQVIAGSFRFPAWTQQKENPGRNVITTVETPVSIIDLNTASAEDLRVVNGVGEVLSSRIVKYRQSIGGFVSVIQLNDVYGLSPEVIAKITSRFQILNRPRVEKKNINTVNAGELAELPYFEYGLAQKIISYRILNEGIQSFEELSKIDGFPSDKIDRIKLYLALE